MMVMSIVLPCSTDALVCACSDMSKATDPWLGQIHPWRGHPNLRANRPEQEWRRIRRPGSFEAQRTRTRPFYLVMSLLLAGIAVLGFSRTMPGGLSAPGFPALLWVHAAAFTAWVLLAVARAWDGSTASLRPGLRLPELDADRRVLRHRQWQRRPPSGTVSRQHWRDADNLGRRWSRRASTALRGGLTRCRSCSRTGTRSGQPTCPVPTT